MFFTVDRSSRFPSLQQHEVTLLIAKTHIKHTSRQYDCFEIFYFQISIMLGITAVVLYEYTIIVKIRRNKSYKRSTLAVKTPD